MKSKLILAFSILSISMFAQIPNNQRQWFANVVLLDSTTRYEVGLLGAGKIIKDVAGNGIFTWSEPDFIDSLWFKTDSICYSKGNKTYCRYFATGSLAADSIYQKGDSICYDIGLNKYCFFNKTSGVDTIYRKANIDSIFYKKNNVEYAIKDSVGGGGSSSLAIGDTINSATNGSVLFAGASGILSQNNQRLFWNNSTQNLGIGLNNPTARLTVKGNHINSSSNALEVHDSTGSSNALIVKNDNRVGIGTNAPGATLDIASNTSINSFILRNSTENALFQLRTSAGGDRDANALYIAAPRGMTFESNGNTGGGYLFSFFQGSIVRAFITTSGSNPRTAFTIRDNSGGTAACEYRIVQVGNIAFWRYARGGGFANGITMGFGTSTEVIRLTEATNVLIGTNLQGTSATKTLVINNGVAPTGDVTDSFQQYSADIVAGNAAPHFRTENGSIIKLYQETTAVGSASYTHNASTAIHRDDTFGGYTLEQVVQALKNLGILQ